jgi:hypothetical protein
MRALYLLKELSTHFTKSAKNDAISENDMRAAGVVEKRASATMKMLSVERVDGRGRGREQLC